MLSVRLNLDKLFFVRCLELSKLLELAGLTGAQLRILFPRLVKFFFHVSELVLVASVAYLR